MARKVVAGGTGRTVSARSVSLHLSRLLFRPFRAFHPSGIGTYSQVGAQFGFTMLWTMLLTYPLMAGIQEISALLGRVTGVGIAGNIRRHYSPMILYSLVPLLLIANVI